MLLLHYCCWRRRFSLSSSSCPTTSSALTLHLFTGLAVLQHSSGELILILFTVCSFMTDKGTHRVSVAQPVGQEFHTAGKCGKGEDKANPATDLSSSSQVPQRWLRLHFAMLMDGGLQARLELGSPVIRGVKWYRKQLRTGFAAPAATGKYAALDAP